MASIFTFELQPGKRSCQKSRNSRPFLHVSEWKSSDRDRGEFRHWPCHALALALQGVQQVVTARSADKLGALKRELPIDDPAEIDRRAAAGEGLLSTDVAEAITFMLTRPRNVTIRDLVVLRTQDL